MDICEITTVPAALTSLHFLGSVYARNSAEVARACPQLREFSCEWTPQQDDEYARGLSAMTALTSLGTGSASQQDPSTLIATIAQRLTQLTHLQVTAPVIRDDSGLAKLARLPLTSLQLCSGIDGFALTSLKFLEAGFDRLRRLGLQDW